MDSTRKSTTTFSEFDFVNLHVALSHIAHELIQVSRVQTTTINRSEGAPVLYQMVRNGDPFRIFDYYICMPEFAAVCCAVIFGYDARLRGCIVPSFSSSNSIFLGHGVLMLICSPDDSPWEGELA